MMISILGSDLTGHEKTNDDGKIFSIRHGKSS